MTNAAAQGTDLPAHVAENRRYWDIDADNWVAAGERSWQAPEPRWGFWGTPESELKLLPDDMHGRRAIELGCGTGYVSAWMHRRGASVSAIDNSERQLATARRLAVKHRAEEIVWMHGSAERVDRPDASFDFAITEYGAVTWCDPYAWVPEAARLLRPGGDLVIMGNHPLAIVCAPLDGSMPILTSLQRDYFGLHGIDWSDVPVDPGGFEFNLTVSGWMRLFREAGFDVLDYVEVQAPAGATGERYGTPADWARRFPAEQVWKLRRR